MHSLTLSNLHQLSGDIQQPAYVSAAPAVGIVHFGVGNFHRSHQAMYVDRLLQAHPDQPWAICGMGVRDEDRAMAHALAEQDGLYSLSLFDAVGSRQTQIIASIREFIFVPDNPAAALAKLADPAVRIVSLTITESGYVEDVSNGRTAADDAGIRADIAAELSSPRTAFGLIVAGLQARREAGVEPFTVLSCDNIQDNGTVARQSILATARLADAGLAAWIEQNVAFPSTMVDRITPRTASDQHQQIDAALGLHDQVPVVAEPFEQWILEDNFPAGRPLLEEVGAVFVDDIATYESMKLRLLNGSHQVLAYAGMLAGHRFAHEAITDPAVRAWVDGYARELALPTVELPDGVDGHQYISTLWGRFENPAIADTLERLATDSMDRMAKFVAPVLRDAGATEAYASIAPLIVASWIVAIAETDSPVVLASIPAELRAVLRAGEPGQILDSVPWLAPFADDAPLRRSVSELVRELRNTGDKASVLGSLAAEQAEQPRK